jgi:hypothetical protein
VMDATHPRRRGSRMKSREEDHLYPRKVLEEADWPLLLSA